MYKCFVCICALCIGALVVILWGCQDIGEQLAPISTEIAPVLTPDGDFDGDGILNSVDTCVLIHNIDQFDSDGDGIGNSCDNCPQHVNKAQEDGDRDGYGDNCDACPADRAYATKDEESFCVAEEEQEYSFTLVKEIVIDYTNELFARLSEFVGLDFLFFGQSLAYIGDNIINGSKGAMLAVASTGPNWPAADRRSEQDTYRQAVYLVHLNSDATVNDFFQLSSRQTPDTPTGQGGYWQNVYYQDAYYLNIEDGNNFGVSIADMGVHRVNGNERRIMAIGDPNYGGMVLLFELNPTNNWIAARTHTQYAPQSHSEFGNGRSTGFGASLAYLGTAMIDGSSRLLLAIGERRLQSRDLGRYVYPDNPRIHVVVINSDDLSIYRVGHVYTDESRAVFEYDFGNAVAHLSAYAAEDRRLIATSAPHRVDAQDSKGKIYLYQLTPSKMQTDAFVQEIPIRVHNPSLVGGASDELVDLHQSLFYLNEIDLYDYFGVALHDLGDVDGDGPIHTTLVIGAIGDDDGGRSTDQTTNRGAVYLLYLSDIMQDSQGMPYVELLRHQKISDLTPGGPVLKKDSNFGRSITSFEMNSKQYLAIGDPQYGRVHLFEYR